MDDLVAVTEALPIEVEYGAAVIEGKQIVERRETDKMRLGELANQVGKSYGEGRLAQYATDIGVNESSLNNYRSVFRAWEGKDQPADNFAAKQALAGHPERAEILANEPTMPKSKARAIAKTAKAVKKAKSEPAEITFTFKPYTSEDLTDLIAELDAASIANGEAQESLKPWLLTIPLPRKGAVFNHYTHTRDALFNVIACLAASIADLRTLRKAADDTEAAIKKEFDALKKAPKEAAVKAEAPKEAMDIRPDPVPTKSGNGKKSPHIAAIENGLSNLFTK